MRRSLSCLALASAAVAVVNMIGTAQQPATATFGEDQATRGRQTYDQRCAECHVADLKGGSGPALVGSSFLSGWGMRTAQELFVFVKGSMPPGAEGSLSDDVYLDIVSYVLQANGHAAGAQPLRADSTLVLGAAGGGGVRAAAASGQAAVSPAAPQRDQDVPIAGAVGPVALLGKQVTNYTPVTNQMLQNPPPGEWLSWRRTLDGQGYSPLNQITRDNVSNLRMAWAWSMAEGGAQMTPLIHDGVLFLTAPGNVIQALDAKTGNIIWEYKRTFASGSRGGRGPTRTIALYGDKVYMTTSDAAVVAIDARTGRLVWETQKADPSKGFTHSGGPIIANGVVVSGIQGCARFTKEGCFVTGHDAETGKELWRTSTIAVPPDPNNESWGKVPPGVRGGTDMWIPGSYDPQLNLFYIGTAQAKPWVPVSRGTTAFDAVLYSNSTLALDPKTGKMNWHFQHVPGESLDLDTVFERVLVDIGDQKVLFTVGKDGLLWKLDRRTGAFLGVKETVYQNIFDLVDDKTGKLRYRADIIEAKVGDWIPACPGYYGGHNWFASAYSPETSALVVPLNQHCLEMKPRKVDLVEGAGSGTGGDVRFFEMPGTEGNFGRLSAFDVRTLQQLWTHEQHASFSTGALTTAGGLVFIGDVDRHFKAFDVRTGKVLWQVRLGTSALGFPITYTIDGKQYVAVPTGTGAFPNIRRLLSPDVYAPIPGSGLYVFELPGR